MQRGLRGKTKGGSSTGHWRTVPDGKLVLTQETTCLYKSPVGAEQKDMRRQTRSEIFLQVKEMEKMYFEGLVQSQENCCLGRREKSMKDTASKEVRVRDA